MLGARMCTQIGHNNALRYDSSNSCYAKLVVRALRLTDTPLVLTLLTEQSNIVARNSRE